MLIASAMAASISSFVTIGIGLDHACCARAVTAASSASTYAGDGPLLGGRTGGHAAYHLMRDRGRAGREGWLGGPGLGGSHFLVILQ